MGLNICISKAVIEDGYPFVQNDDANSGDRFVDNGLVERNFSACGRAAVAGTETGKPTRAKAVASPAHSKQSDDSGVTIDERAE